jgi:phospholipid/cholesterol/gamma-HCH transport system substrate-binding protein
MLLRFGGTTIKLLQNGHQIDVHMVSDRADGLAEGAVVLYRGVSVGKVTRILRSGDQAVDIDAEIDDTPPLPGNLEGIIRTQSLISGIAGISLELTGGPKAVPQGHLADNQNLKASFVGSDLIPPEIGQLAGQLELTTKEVRQAQLVLHLDETVRGARDYVTDPKLRSDIQASLENIHHVSESIARSADNIEKFSTRLEKVADEATSTMVDAHSTVRSAQMDVEKLSKQIDDRMLQVSKSLDSIQAITGKVNAGEGTAGMLVNDPKLYQSLVENSRELNLTITDLRRLVDQWEQEGVTLKLK